MFQGKPALRNGSEASSTCSIWLGFAVTSATTRLLRVVALSCCGLLFEVAEDFAGGVGAGGSCDAVAGVSAVAAEVEASYRGRVARPAENGAHGENLVEGEFAVEGVAAG
jgi:hypothetical protein